MNANVRTVTWRDVLAGSNGLSYSARQRLLDHLEQEEQTKRAAAVFIRQLREIRDDETKSIDVRTLAGLELENFLAELADGGF